MAVLVGFSNIPAPTSVAAGAAVDARSMERKTVTIESVGTGTYQVQISLDPSEPPAIASWRDEGTAFTAVGTLEISKPCAWIRINTTAYTSGNPIVRMAGLIEIG